MTTAYADVRIRDIVNAMAVDKISLSEFIHRISDRLMLKVGLSPYGGATILLGPYRRTFSASFLEMETDEDLARAIWIFVVSSISKAVTIAREPIAMTADFAKVVLDKEAHEARVKRYLARMDEMK